MSSLLQSTQGRVSSLSKTTLFESKKLLSWNAERYRKETLELLVLPSNSEYQKGFEARRWTSSENYKAYTPNARIIIS